MTGGKDSKAEREARLAETLRQNLLRRKAQARAVRSADDPAKDDYKLTQRTDTPDD